MKRALLLFCLSLAGMSCGSSAPEMCCCETKVDPPTYQTKLKSECTRCVESTACTG